MIDLDELPLDVTDQILKFRDFFIICWPQLDKFILEHDWDDDVDFIDDWIQVNWEFLVERELLGKEGYLLPLNLGSRITQPD